MKKKILAAALCLFAVAAWAQTIYKVTGADNIANTLIGYFASSSSGEGLLLAVAPSVYDGTTWDMLRSGSVVGSVLTSDVTTDPCLSSATTKLTAPIGVTSATTTQLVALTASQVVYVCGFSMTISQVVTTANTIKFVYGTGTACDTGAADLTGTYGAGGVTAGIPIVVSAGGNGTLFKTASANALCVTTAIGASGSFQGVVTYVKQ